VFKVNSICTLAPEGVGGSPSPRLAQHTLRWLGVTAEQGNGRRDGCSIAVPAAGRCAVHIWAAAAAHIWAAPRGWWEGASLGVLRGEDLCHHVSRVC